MQKNQKSVRGGIEDFLCPFTDMYITQGANSNFSHKGIMANDVRGELVGIKYPYYAPCTCKCLKTYPNSGQAMWQSINKVRFANGRVDYATFMTAHDDSLNVQIGQVVAQGEQLGNMGTKGNATGVHCHIEISQSADTTWAKNQYGNYHFNNEYDLDECYFVDNTNILNGMGGSWKTTKEVTIPDNSENNKNYINLPPDVTSWRFYDLDKSPIKENAKGTLNPQKFGGLSYYIYEYKDNNTTAVIETIQFGKVKIYIATPKAKITIGTYLYQEGNH